MIVVDASVVINALADDDQTGRNARQRLRRERLTAPEVIDLEVVSALRRMCARGQITTERAGQAVVDLSDLRLDRVPHRPLLWRCWELRENLTTHDAAYVALAEALDATLLTADERLASAPGGTCTIDVLT